MKTKHMTRKERGSRQFRASALALAMVFMAFAAYAETVSISTYYPSPYGSYQTIETTTTTNLATNSGGVAIGKTTAATEKLEVAGNALIGATGTLMIGSQDADTANLKPGVAGGDLLISDDSGTVASGITVIEGGNVGVGKAPVYKLDVAGDTNIDGTLRVKGTTNANVGVLQLDCNGTNCYAVYA